MKGRRIRKTYFVEEGLQLRFTGMILGVAFLAALGSGLTVFFSIWMIMTEKLAAVYPQGLFVYMVYKVLAALTKNMSFMGVLIFLLGIFISHRIGGPVFRLKRVIRGMGEGRLDEPVHLRKTDELRDLAAELEHMRMRLNARLASK